MRDFQTELEHWANMLPPPDKPRITRIKAGPAAYQAMRIAFPSGQPPGFKMYGGIVNGMMMISNVPVDVLDGPSWPANLLVAIDQEGNAMKAWILND